MTDKESDKYKRKDEKDCKDIEYLLSRFPIDIPKFYA